nr:SMC family ATPase [Vibrio cyclitrophicus]PME27490.1 hypothetical protein BCV41_00930 [Vibrio cyclitrophicus]
MNNQSIKFLSATIRNFRGVPSELHVPLDAPLTVIHAANGTGKSTICYALEWLLTGKVEDLNTTNFSCQWGKGETSVSATCLIGRESYELTRKGAAIWIAKDGARKKKIKEADLLNLLTPESISGRSVHATKKAKRDWLRNSRWLYSNSLSLLVDNNKAEARQQIFSDILGLGHLTSTLRDLRDYRTQLPSTKGLQENVKLLSDEILEMETKLAENLPNKEHATTKLNTILKSFPQVKVTDKIEENYKLVRLQVETLEQKIKGALNNLEIISEHWEQYHTEKDQLNHLQENLTELSKANEAQIEEHTELSKELSSMEIKAAEGLRSVIWSKERVDVLNRWEHIVSLPSIKDYFSSGTVTRSALQQDFVEFSWGIDKQESWCRSVDYLIQNCMTVTNLVMQKQDLASNIVYAPINFVEVQRNAEQATYARLKAESDFNALSSILDKLKTIGKEITHSNDGGQCPLCNHNWGDSDSLRKQIDNEALWTPELRKAAQEQEKAVALEREALANLTLVNNQKNSYEAYLARVAEIDNQLNLIEHETKYLEIMNVNDFSNFNETNILYLKERIRAALDLQGILKTLEDVGNIFDKPPIEGIFQQIQIARENLNQYNKHYDSQEKTSNSEKARILPLTLGTMDKIKAKSREIESVKSNISIISKSMSNFSSMWNEVVERKVINLETYHSTLSKFEEDRLKVFELKSTLNECGFLVNIDIDSSQLNKLRTKKEELSKKLEVGTKYISEAEVTIDSYSKYVQKLTSSSLAPLLEPAAELFSRMHANEVYKGLSVSDGEALKWTVFADGHEFALDAEERFSQGQRQDLALSLYLARARNTNGSFFLDEPIAHLDDLNRVAMLDILRLFATSMPNMNLVLTTASDSLARHLAQKFSSINDRHLLNMIHLEGNPRTGVSCAITTNLPN